MENREKYNKQIVKNICNHFGVKLKKKSESLLMKIVGFFVSKIFHTMSYNEFMNGFITTVFSTIYYTEEEHITYGILVHEITHVLQYKKFQVLKYLTKRGRAELELEAFSAELEYMILSGTKINESALDKLSKSLYKYGLGEKEVTFVKKQLENVVMNATRGKVTSSVAKVVAELTKE